MTMRAQCPLCQKLLPGDQQQQSLHVELCLLRAQSSAHAGTTSNSAPTPSTPATTTTTPTTPTTNTTPTTKTTPGTPRWGKRPRIGQRSQLSLERFLCSGAVYCSIPDCFYLDYPSMTAQFLRDPPPPKPCTSPNTTPGPQQSSEGVHFLGNFRFDRGAGHDCRLYSNVPAHIWRLLLAHGPRAFTPQPSASQATTTPLPHYPISFLKSHLQKAVRRCSPMHAVMTAFHLMIAEDKDATGWEGWKHLLRRLPIIMLEDATLLPALTPLVWLMVLAGTLKPEVSPVRAITQADMHIAVEIASWVLFVVENMAICAYRDPMSEDKWRNEHRKISPWPGSLACSVPKQTLSDGNHLGLGEDELQPLLPKVRLECKWIAFELPSEHRNLLYALQLRANYGDQEMLQQAVQVWALRFTRHQQQQQSKPEGMAVRHPTILSQAILQRPLTRAYRNRILEGKWLLPQQWIAAAVDFHVVPQIADRLWHQFSAANQQRVLRIYGPSPRDQDDAEEVRLEVGLNFVRSMLWEKSSGVNRKQSVDPAVDGFLSDGRFPDALMDSLWETYQSAFHTMALSELKLRVKYS